MKFWGKVHFTIQVKFLICYVLFLIFPLIASGFLIYNKSSILLTDSGKNYAHQKLQKLTDSIDIYLQNIQAVSLDICYNTNIQNILSNFNEYDLFSRYTKSTEISNLIGANRLASNKIFLVHITNSSFQNISIGVMRIGSEKDDMHFYLSDKSQDWKVSFKTQSYIMYSSYYNILSFYQKVIDLRTKQLLGMVRIDINETSIRDLYAPEAKAANIPFFILDSDNNLISSVNAEDIGKAFNSVYQTDFNIPDHTAGELFAQINGENHLVVYNTLKTTGWKIVSLYSTVDIYRDSEAIKNYIVLIAIVCIIFGALLFFIFSRLIVKPIHRLKATMEEVDKGNLDLTFTITTTDEIAALGKSFNEMIIRIKSLIDKIFTMQQQEIKAEKLYLQSQINPHFLYNTLDGIRFLARKNNDLEVSKQIEALSNLFKHVLNKGVEYTTFNDELDHLKNYMVIQLQRFQDRISFTVEMDEDILPLYTIKLILQPLVENCIVHGLENKRESGTIHIKGKIAGDTVVINITDDGVGMDEKRLLEAVAGKENTSFALNNIQTRLRLHFGEAYGIKIKSKLMKGTSVTVTLPVLNKVPVWR